MPTTIHIPAQLLKSVDRRARVRKVSRNRYIIEALRTQLEVDRRQDQWPQSLFDEMRAWRKDESHVAAVRAMKRDILVHRRSKRA